MSLNRRIQKIQQLDQLIRLQCTGTPNELAKKLNISESSLYYLLAFIKDHGAQIIYNHSSSTYKYVKPIRFFFGFIEDFSAIKNNKSQ